MITDEQMDVRLQAAGTRWRAEHDTPATVDLTALQASDSAVTGLVHEVLPEPSAFEAPARHRRNRWLAAAGGIAAAALATVLVVQFGGNSTSGAPAGGQAGRLSGTAWVLSGMHTAKGADLPVADAVPLQFDAGPSVLGGDGCGTFNGPVSVSARDLTVRDLAHSANGCIGLSSSATRQISLIQAVIERGTVRWSVSGSTLTLARPGVGSLDYTAVAPGATPPPSVGTAGWTLQQVEVVKRIGNGSSDTGNGSYTHARLTFNGTGAFTVNAPCSAEVGTATFSGSSVQFSGRHDTYDAAGCSPYTGPGGRTGEARELSKLDSVLTGTTRWAVHNGSLTLSRAGITLTFGL